jgi:hypothetical protein
MGPDPSHNPAIKSVEELANVGAFLQLPQIPVLLARYPDLREPILQQLA